MTEQKTGRIMIRCSLLSLQPASAVREAESAVEETLRFTEGLCKRDWFSCCPGRLQDCHCPNNLGSRLVSIVIARQGDLPRSLGREVTVATDVRRILG